ncbi:MAG: hypothetical protein ACFFGZ_12275 [Candidatus Thorarchaeota archaeon]
MSSKHLLVNKSRLFWLFTFDTLKLRDSLRNISRQLAESPIIQGWTYYYDPSERHLGLSEIMVKDEAEEESSAQSLFELLQRTDFFVLDEEFFEAQTYTRFLLEGFRLRHPLLPNPLTVDVLFMLTKWGVGCLGFCTDTEDPLTPAQLATLQLILKKEEPVLKAELPLKLLEEIGHFDADIRARVEAAREKGKTTQRIGTIAMGQIAFYYMSAIISVINGRKFDSMDEIAEKQRYETYIPHPLIIIEEATPSYDSAFELVEKHPREIYQILEQLEYVDPTDITNQAAEKFADSISTDREDIWYNASIGSSLQIVTPRTREIAKLNPEHDEESNYLVDIFQPYVENEIVQIQRYLILMLEFYLSSQDMTELQPNELSNLKETIVKSLEIFHGVRVSGNSISKERIELGKEVTLVNLVQETIDRKLLLIETGVAEYQESLKDFTQAILGVILGVVPAILLVLPGDDIVKLGLSVILSVGLTVAARYSAKYIWKRKRQRQALI